MLYYVFIFLALSRYYSCYRDVTFMSRLVHEVQRTALLFQDLLVARYATQDQQQFAYREYS